MEMSKAALKPIMSLFCYVGKLIEAAMEYFGIESTSSPSTKHVPQQNIQKTHVTRRPDVFDEAMDGFFETLISPLSAEEVGRLSYCY